MREIRTSGSMSGEGKRTATQHRASPRLYCLTPWNSGASPKGAITLWVQVPPGQWSVGLVAGRRCGWVTGRIEALRQTLPWATERIDGP